MVGNLSIRNGGIALACAASIFALIAGTAAAAGGNGARGGALISVQNQFVSEFGLRYVEPSVPVEFNITLTNTGGDNPGNSRFSFPVPAGLTEMSWSCQPVKEASCVAPKGNGAILDESIEALGPGDAIVYRVRAQQLAEVPPYITSTAQVDLDDGAACSDGQTSPCTSIARVPAGANFNVSLSGERTGQGTARFSYVAFHTRHSRSASNVRIFSEIPAGVQSYTWTCEFTGSQERTLGQSNVCPAASGSGSIDQDVDFWFGGDGVTYTIDAVLEPTATDDIAVSVLVVPESDDGSSCGSEASQAPCVALEVLPGTPRILLSNEAEVLASGDIAYTVTVVNPGSSSASLIINNPTPNGIIGLIDFACTRSGVAECPNDPRLDFRELVLPAGGTLIFNFIGLLNRDIFVPEITNTVTAQMPAGGLCNAELSAPPCVASVTTGLLGSLAVTKTSDTASAVPAQLITYTINVSNNSSIPLSAVQIRDDVPNGIAAFESWTCTSSAAGECPTASGSGALLELVPTISANESLTYTVQARAANTLPSNLQNVATVQFAAGGVVCEDSSLPPPCTAQSGIPSAITYTVSKIADKAQLDAGVLSYELRIAKSGGVAGNVRIVDTIPVGVSGFAWTCTSDVAFCPQGSGTGSIDMTLGELPPGNLEYVFSVQATLDSSPPSEIINTLTVTPPSTSRCISGGIVTLPPCVAIATTQLAQSLSVTKTASDMQLLRGGFANYLVTVVNEGVGVGEVVVRDAQAVGLDTMQWQCTGYFGVDCPVSSGVGSIDMTFVSFPANGRVEFNVLGAVAADAPSTITNVASIVPPSNATCLPAGCAAEVTLPVVNSPAPNFNLTLAANVSQAAPAQAIVYTLDLRNLGEIPAKGASINVPLPAGVTSFTWACAGEECPAPSGSGAIAQTIPFWPVYSALEGQGRLLYTITALISDTPPASIGLSATIAPNGLGSCVGGVCTVSLSIPVIAVTPASIDLTITADRTEVDAGGNIVYEITLSNQSAADAAAIDFSNPLAAGLSGMTWQCRVVGSAQCPRASGTGAINQTLSILPANSAVLYSISANVLSSATTSIVNMASATTSDRTICNPLSCQVSVSTFVTTAAGPDIALRNQRPYSAAGISGTLIDVVNLSGPMASNVPVRLTPASARRLLAAYASGCTASTGSAGSVVVSCPNPGVTQGVRCLEGVCTIDQLVQGAAVTLFVALNEGTSATLRAEGSGDANEANNTIALPIGATP